MWSSRHGLSLLSLAQDPVLQVRISFTQKLHKYLLAMKVPLQYMAIFSLCANDRVKDRKSTVKQYIELNIQKRREYLRKHPATNSESASSAARASTTGC